MGMNGQILPLSLLTWTIDLAVPAAGLPTRAAGLAGPSLASQSSGHRTPWAQGLPHLCSRNAAEGWELRPDRLHPTPLQG